MCEAVAFGAQDQSTDSFVARGLITATELEGTFQITKREIEGT